MGQIGAMACVVKPKLGAAVHTDDYLPVTQRHSPKSIIQNASLWNFCSKNPHPALYSYWSYTDYIHYNCTMMRKIWCRRHIEVGVVNVKYRWKVVMLLGHLCLLAILAFAKEATYKLLQLRVPLPPPDISDDHDWWISCCLQVVLSWQKNSIIKEIGGKKFEKSKGCLGFPKSQIQKATDLTCLLHLRLKGRIKSNHSFITSTKKTKNQRNQPQAA